MHFPFCFRFSPIFEKFSDSVENFQNFTFSRKRFRFSSAKISYDLLLVIDYKFEISPLFTLLQYISAYFGKDIISPLLSQISPLISSNLRVFLHTFCVFRFPPYFDHDAFMHHTMHVLDAPAFKVTTQRRSKPRPGQIEGFFNQS